MPLPFIINVSLGGLIFFIGFAFAFLPFQDRPIDQWIVAFIKSVYSPTQFVYRKDNMPPSIIAQVSTTSVSKNINSHHKKQFINSKQMLNNYLSRLPKNTSESLDQNELVFLNQTMSLFNQKPKQEPKFSLFIKRPPAETKVKAPSPSTPQQTIKKREVPAPVHKPPQLNQQIDHKETNKSELQQLSDELIRLKQLAGQEKTQKVDHAQLEKRFLELEQKLTNLLTEREKLTAELAQLKKQGTQVEEKTVKPAAIKEDIQMPSVKIISQQQATKVGILNTPSIPNIVLGVVKDPNDITLPNILITVKDLRGSPLRALKTNKLGQFFASTALPSGTYVLEIEDPHKRYSFDLVELKLIGKIVQPIEIVAKNKIDPVRERLTKELFQKNFN